MWEGDGMTKPSLLHWKDVEQGCEGMCSYILYFDYAKTKKMKLSLFQNKDVALLIISLTKFPF